MKNILIVLFSLFYVSFLVAQDGQQFAWHGTYSGLNRIEFLSGITGSPLPNTFEIDPGYYTFNNRVYDLRANGYYRFTDGATLENRLVRDGDQIDLLHGLLYAVHHGNLDESLGDVGLSTAAKTRKLRLTCGFISRWVNTVMSNNGFANSVRLVNSLTGNEFNTFSNGHLMVEVFIACENKWVLYDATGNCYFTDRNNKKLNLLEFGEVVREDKFYKINYVTRGESKADTDFTGTGLAANFAQYTYFALSKEDAKTWYKRAIHTVMINVTAGTNGFHYITDSSRDPIITGFSSNYSPVSEATFMSTYYP